MFIFSQKYKHICNVNICVFHCISIKKDIKACEMLVLSCDYRTAQNLTHKSCHRFHIPFLLKWVVQSRGSSLLTKTYCLISEAHISLSVPSSKMNSLLIYLLFCIVYSEFSIYSSGWPLTCGPFDLASQLLVMQVGKTPSKFLFYFLKPFQILKCLF